MNTSSCGLDALISSSAAAATLGRFSRMLPLLSIMIPIDTGTSSRLKIFSGCSTLSSYTLNADCGRLVISLPLLSITLTCSGTSFVSLVKTAGSSGAAACAGGGVCPKAIVPQKMAATNRLLRRCIISSTECWLERRQAHRLYQLNLHPPVFSILDQIFRRIAENVLIPQFKPDLGRHVRQFRQVVDAEILAAGLLGKLP